MYCSTQFGIITRGITRFSIVPIRRIGGGAQGQLAATKAIENDYDSTAKLSKHPRTLLILWHEFLYGPEDNKPAKDFTSHEHGYINFKYSHCKCFWGIMPRLINGGFTQLTAIDKI
jgi:hypothetical protein